MAFVAKILPLTFRCEMLIVKPTVWVGTKVSIDFLYLMQLHGYLGAYFISSEGKEIWTRLMIYVDLT